MNQMNMSYVDAMDIMAKLHKGKFYKQVQI